MGLGAGGHSKLPALRQKLADMPAVYERMIFGILGIINLAMTWQLVILKLNV